MDCEFEEKQYEQLMNYELADRGKIYPAGQCLEKDIGIDAALFFSKNSSFWRNWNKDKSLNERPGVNLSPKLWETAEAKLRSSMFPKFKCNLFIQYKRPEKIISPNGKEYPDWGHSYFRYKITSHQQKTLCKLERKTTPHAIVAYSCASFRESDRLWQLADANRLVENSNFVQPHKLVGHNRYTFIADQPEGKAFSEPTKVTGIDLLKEVERLSINQLPFKDNFQFITSLAYDIKEIILSLENKQFTTWYYNILEKTRHYEHSLATSLATIFAFNFYANTSWSIGYQTDPKTDYYEDTNDARLSAFIKQIS
jgi:hypothetical protein